MSSVVKVVIIDDEPYSRDELIHLLSNYPTIEVIGEAESGKQGLEKILTLSPDVIFVDMEMGEMNGIEVVEIINKLENPPKVVFATAYPDFAAKAFRLDAIDYLLKPFSEEEIGQTVEKIHASRKVKTNEKGQTLKLAIESEGSIVYLSPSDIVYCCRMERETQIVTPHNSFCSKLTLKELEEKLEPYGFFRTHKSYLVHIEKVERLIPWFNGAYQLKVIGFEEEIPVSRNYVKALRKRLEL